METLAQLMETHGINPRGRVTTGSIDRAIMQDWLTIINTAPEDFRVKIGNPCGAIALVSKNPQRDAEAAQEFLAQRGYESEVLGELDPGAPPGALVFLKTNVLLAGLVVFRWPLYKMRPMPEKWRYTL